MAVTAALGFSGRHIASRLLVEGKGVLNLAAPWLGRPYLSEVDRHFTTAHRA
jgi:hypothetical protein